MDEFSIILQAKLTDADCMEITHALTEAYNRGKADAIDEFLNELKNYTLWEEHETILEIVAEQLKEQKND